MRDRTGAGVSNLNESVAAWCTPKALTGGANSKRAERGAGGPDLQEQSSQWQTPATDIFRSRGGDRVDEMGLDQQARFWPSPQSRDHRSGETLQDYGNPRPLNEAVVKWATPRREDGESAGNHPNASDSLTGQTRLWNTPTTEDRAERHEPHSQGGLPLTAQAHHWNTPHGQGNRDASGKVGGSGGGEFAKQVNSFQDSPSDPPMSDGPKCFCGSHGCDLPTHKRKLNPIFETWLMGWPLWWLTSVPALYGLPEMVSYRFRLRSRLSFLLEGRD